MIYEIWRTGFQFFNRRLLFTRITLLDVIAAHANIRLSKIRLQVNSGPLLPP